MKIRTGFVSNSSSSSFIISVDDLHKTRVKLTIEVDLKDYADKIIYNERDLLNYLINEGHHSIESALECSWIRDEVVAIQKALFDGKIVIIGTFCGEGDNSLELFLYQSNLRHLLKNQTEISVIRSAR